MELNCNYVQSCSESRAFCQGDWKWGDANAGVAPHGDHRQWVGMPVQKLNQFYTILSSGRLHSLHLIL